MLSMRPIFPPEGIDEYGNKGSPVPRFTDNKDCQKAFKAYMCYINFPRSGNLYPLRLFGNCLLVKLCSEESGPLSACPRKTS